MTSVRPRVGAVLALAAWVLLFGATRASGAAVAISLQAAPAHLHRAGPVTLSGLSTGAPADSTVQLTEYPYPYEQSRLLGTTTTAADGSFSFRVRADRDATFTAALPGTTATATVAVKVGGPTITRVRALTLGRASVKLLVFHPRDLRWNRARVHWWFATGWRGRFTSAPATHTRRVSPYVTELTTAIALPAGHFRWRACFHAASDHALENPRRPPGCTGRGYYGGGVLPVGYPTPADVSRAAGYLAGRTGRTAFAVVDSEGRLSGVNVHWTFLTASVVKAMLLVAYLRRLDARGQHDVDSYSNSFLYPMIHVSDNNAATQCWSIVGDSGLYAVARAARMTEFSVSGSWGTALLSPADQARFFFEMDSLIPKEFVGYARRLLSTIIAWQSFGIPVVARPLGYNVFFKDGSEPTALGQLVHQVARLEGHGRTFTIAVMTDGDPTMQYGIDTLQGVAAALLR